MHYLLFDRVNIDQNIPLVKDRLELISENLEKKFVYLGLDPINLFLSK